MLQAVTSQRDLQINLTSRDPKHAMTRKNMLDESVAFATSIKTVGIITCKRLCPYTCSAVVQVNVSKLNKHALKMTTSEVLRPCQNLSSKRQLSIFSPQIVDAEQFLRSYGGHNWLRYHTGCVSKECEPVIWLSNDRTKQKVYHTKWRNALKKMRLSKRMKW